MPEKTAKSNKLTDIDMSYHCGACDGGGTFFFDRAAVNPDKPIEVFRLMAEVCRNYHIVETGCPANGQFTTFESQKVPK